MKKPTSNFQLPTSGKSLKVALVCDWLTGIGGAERVVLEMHKLFPNAPIYTSQYDPNKIDWFKEADVRTTWLQKLPTRLKKFLPLLRAASFSRLDLSDYDLILSSSGAEAKYVRTSPKNRSQYSTDNSVRKCVHIAYIHAPTHYYWRRYDYYMKHPGFGKLNWAARLGLRLLAGPLRKWDYKAAQKPNLLIANSTHIQQEIKKYYKRESTVIHPPVDIERFSEKAPLERKGFVIIGRQTPYKRFDLAVKACTKIGAPLTVIGDGPENKKLRELAGPTINFIAHASDEEVVAHMMSAEAFIFPGIDDFGIVAVEALAAGTPVIAFKGGGALDYVTDKNGAFFEEQTAESLAETLKNFKPEKYAYEDIKRSAEAFSNDKFREKLNLFINQSIK